MSLQIGVDESGTGAWAGPFTLCAVLIDTERFSELGKELNDSKVLSDKKRRLLVPRIREKALGVFTFSVGVDSIRQLGQRPSWRTAIVHVVAAARARMHLLRDEDRLPFDVALDMVPIIIDGPVDRHVKLDWITPNVSWEINADSKYPSVMAASIVAKTERNDAMKALHAEYPYYGWSVNSGYGTRGHIAQIARYGLTNEHRPIKDIDRIKLDENGEVVEWRTRKKKS